MDFANPALFGADPRKNIVAVEFDGPSTALVFVREASGFTRVEPHAFHPTAGRRRTARRSRVRTRSPRSANTRAGPTSRPTAPPRGIRLQRRRLPIPRPHRPHALQGHDLRVPAPPAAPRRPRIPEGAPHPDPEHDPLAAIALTDSSGWEELLEIDGDESERAALERLAKSSPSATPTSSRATTSSSSRSVPHRPRPPLQAAPALGPRRQARSPPPPRACRSPKRRSNTPASPRAAGILSIPSSSRSSTMSAPASSRASRSAKSPRTSASRNRQTPPSPPDRSPQPAPGDARLAATLSASYFIQAQIFPYNYQDVIVGGNATKIDAPSARIPPPRHSLPQPPETRAFEGGYYRYLPHRRPCRRLALRHRLALTPFMLRFGLLPGNDTLGVFGGLLSALRTFRLEAKRRMREAPTDVQRRHFSALQNTFKIIINSFYGYLGFAQGHFADFEAAAAVTAKGRELSAPWSSGCRAAAPASSRSTPTASISSPPPAWTRGTRGRPARHPARGHRRRVRRPLRRHAQLQGKKTSPPRADGSAHPHRRGVEIPRQWSPTSANTSSAPSATSCAANPPPSTRLRAEFEQAIRDRAWPIERLAKTESLQDSPPPTKRKSPPPRATAPPPSSSPSPAAATTRPATGELLHSPARRKRSSPTKPPA